MASAYDAFIDGIYYNLNQSERTAEVAPNHFSNNSYSGVIEIPGEITYNDITYKVNRIGSDAFTYTGWYNSQSDGLSMPLTSWKL